jgi:hypothetical protein
MQNVHLERSADIVCLCYERRSIVYLYRAFTNEHSVLAFVFVFVIYVSPIC